MVTISTNMFELTIFWNSIYVSLQATVILGLIALSLFAQKAATKRMCLVLLLIDLAAVLFILLNGISVVVEEYEGNIDKKSAPEKETLDVEVTSSEKKQDEKSKVIKKSKKGAVIRNKVPIPNPQQPKNDRPKYVVKEEVEKAKPDVNTSEAKSQDINEEVQTEMKDKVSPEKMETKSVGDFTDEDWESLFSDI